MNSSTVLITLLPDEGLDTYTQGDTLLSAEGNLFR